MGLRLAVCTNKKADHAAEIVEKIIPIITDKVVPVITDLIGKIA